MHKKPDVAEVRACYPWLEAELMAVHPQVALCLGATAAQAIFGSAYRITQERGKFRAHPLVAAVTSTIHPSAVLRASDDESRHAEYEKFVDDLRRVRAYL